MKYGVRVAPDVIIRVEANSEEEARAIVKAELAKKEGSKIYDQAFFDYETGINDLKLRGLLSTAEDFIDEDGKYVSEKENILQNLVGSKGFTRDSSGKLALTPEGQRRYGLKPSSKNIIIDEKGSSSGDWADLLGYAGPVLTAISFLSPQTRVVKSLTNLLFGKPRLARAIAAGSGSAVGKGIEEAAEVAAGIQLQDSAKIADMLKEEFAYGTVAQGAAEGLGALYGTYFGKTADIGKIDKSRFIMEGYNLKDVNRISKEIALKKGINDDGYQAPYKEILKEFKKQNIKPTLTRGIVNQAALGKALASRVQTVGETVTGASTREKRVITNLTDQIDDLFATLGNKSASIENFVDAATAGGFASSGAKLTYNKLLKDIELTDVKQDKLFKLLLDEMGTIRYADPVTEKNVSKNLMQAVEDSFNTWRTTNKKMYSESTDLMKSSSGLSENVKKHIANKSGVFKELIEKVKDENPLLPAEEGYKYLALLEKSVEKDGVDTLLKLVDIRKSFIGKNLALESQGKKDLRIYSINRQIIKSIDEIFDDIEEGSAFVKTEFPISKEDQDTLKSSVRLWRLANKDFAKNINKYDNLVVQKIISQIKNGSKKIDVDEVFSATVKKNNKNNLDGILQAIRSQKKNAEGNYYYQTNVNRVEQITSELQRLLFKNIVDETTDVKTGLVNISKFVKEVKSYGNTLRTLFGPKYDQNMQLLKELSVLDPKITSKEINQILARAEVPGQLKMAGQKEIETIVPELDTANALLRNLKDKADILQAQEKINKTKFMKAVNEKTPDEVVSVLFRPGSAKEIATAKKMISPEEFEIIRENALGQLLTKAVTVGDLKSTAKLTDIFKPGNLRASMNSYGDDTLIEMLGKDVVDGLKALDESIQLQVAAGKGNAAGSIVAGYIGVNALDLAIMPTVVGLKVLTTALSNPGIVRLMAKTDKGSVLQTIEFFERLARFLLAQNIQEETEKTSMKSSIELDKLLKSPEALEYRKQIEEKIGPTLQGIQNLGREATQPRLSTDLGDLPDVTPAVPTPGQAPVSQSLLGGSPANMDIAQRSQRLG